MQYPYLTVLGVGVYALVRVRALAAGSRAAVVRLARVFVPMSITAGLLGAVQLLPTLYFSRQSTRAAGLTLAESSVYSLSPYQLTQFLTPYALGGPRGPYLDVGNFWEFAFHPGVVPLLCATLAVARLREPRVRALLVTAGLGLALGGPAYALFFHVVPLADSFRLPGRFGLFVAFGVAVLAGYGCDRLAAGEITRAKLLVPASVIVGAVGLVGIVALGDGLVQETVVGTVPGLYPRMMRELGAAAVAVGGFIAVAASARTVSWSVTVGGRTVTRRGLLRVVVIALTVGPLVAYGAPLVASEPVGQVYDEPAFERTERVYDSRATLTPNAYRSPTVAEPTNLLDGPRSLGGYNSLQLAASRRLLERLAAGDGRADEPILDAWGVTRLVTVEPVDAPGYEPHGRVDDARVYRNTDAKASAYYVDAPAETGVRVATDERLANATALAVQRNTGRVVAAGQTGDGLVVVTRTYYPLWRATVDGERVSPVRTETGLLAVPVPEGSERVVVEYRSWPLWAGATLSVLGLLWVGLVALHEWGLLRRLRERG